MDNVLRRELEFDNECQMKAKMDWEAVVLGGMDEGWFEHGRRSLPVKVNCWC